MADAVAGAIRQYGPRIIFQLANGMMQGKGPLGGGASAPRRPKEVDMYGLPVGPGEEPAATGPGHPGVPPEVSDDQAFDGPGGAGGGFAAEVRGQAAAGEAGAVGLNGANGDGGGGAQVDEAWQDVLDRLDGMDDDQLGRTIGTLVANLPRDNIMQFVRQNVASQPASMADVVMAAIDQIEET